MLELDEMMARYASYESFAELIRGRFTNASRTLKELFQRLTFNILVGNTDDHARNHAAFWDGRMLSLTPAYDICPQRPSGTEVNQSMLILGQKHASQLALCLDASGNFLLSRVQAMELVSDQLEKITANWATICEEAQLSEIDQKFFVSRHFLRPYAFEGLEGEAGDLLKRGEEFRARWT
jgi:serine/threonine-protein kinase HipA